MWHWGPQYIAPNTATAAPFSDRVNSCDRACGLEKLHRVWNDAMRRNPRTVICQVVLHLYHVTAAPVKYVLLLAGCFFTKGDLLFFCCYGESLQKSKGY